MSRTIILLFVLLALGAAPAHAAGPGPDWDRKMQRSFERSNMPDDDQEPSHGLYINPEYQVRARIPKGYIGCKADGFHTLVIPLKQQTLDCQSALTGTRRIVLYVHWNAMDTRDIEAAMAPYCDPNGYMPGFLEKDFAANGLHFIFCRPLKPEARPGAIEPIQINGGAMGGGLQFTTPDPDLPPYYNPTKHLYLSLETERQFYEADLKIYRAVLRSIRLAK